MAVINTFPGLFPDAPGTPPPGLLLKGILTRPEQYDLQRVHGIREAVATLKRKSRSFYLASAVFPGRLRIDLILLYSFCRVADDLVDDSPTRAEALEWINKMTGYLDLVYSSEKTISPSDPKVQEYIRNNFPKPTRSAFELLPTKLMPSQPFYELLDGFRMDLAFNQNKENGPHMPADYPIKDEADLELYAHRVASTVGELCLWLAFHHNETKLSKDKEAILALAARTMGHALQYVNIARDIAVDADMDRVYLPTTWLKEEGVTPRDIIKAPRQAIVETLRERLLRLAFKEYARSRSNMDMLPADVRGPLIVAVESYMEIGRVLREKKGAWSPKDPKRATVPRSRRIMVAWKVLASQ
ncbi:hypothetical protein PG987_016287 [Apiospora arundinis]